MPQVPNNMSPLSNGRTRAGEFVDSLIAQVWFRFLNELNKSAVQVGGLTPYVGATAPEGWVIDGTVGLPALPTGYIWIRKI